MSKMTRICRRVATGAPGAILNLDDERLKLSVLVITLPKQHVFDLFLCDYIA